MTTSSVKTSLAAPERSLDQRMEALKRANDIRTARAANAPVVAVDFGYTDVPVATFRPDRVISSFAELPAAIDALAPVKNVMDDQAFIGQKG